MQRGTTNRDGVCSKVTYHTVWKPLANKQLLKVLGRDRTSPVNPEQKAQMRKYDTGWKIENGTGL